MLPLQGRHVPGLLDQGRRQRRDVGLRVRVVLVPPDAGGHLQHVADRHAVVAAARQQGQVLRHRLVDAVEVAIGDRGAVQHRDDGLGDRERDPAAVLVVTEAVALEHDGIVLDHQEAGDPAVADVVLDRERLALDLVGHRREIPRRRRQRVGVVGGLEPTHVADLVDVPVARDLLLRGPEQHFAHRPEVLGVRIDRFGGRSGLGLRGRAGAGSERQRQGDGRGACRPANRHT